MAKRKKQTKPSQDDLPKYKEDINAFSVPVEENKDIISGIPSEILHEILSYLIIDHDPDRTAKMHSKDAKVGEKPHVLLSLAAMSHHFHDHVEDFSQWYLIKHKDRYYFKTNAELEEARQIPPRRSERLKQNHQGQDHRCYRIELTTVLKGRCFGCNFWTGRRAIMANGVACCEKCDMKLFRGTDGIMTLTEAKEQYDLRDWMLIPSRNPRLRAKHTDFPVITYGTPYCNGMTISYRFYREDVEKLATAAHGDVAAHMEAKKKERHERNIKRRDVEHRKLKTRYHEDKLGIVKGRAAQKYHRDRLKHYEDPDCAEGYNSADSDHLYGNYDDVHRRLCIREYCALCEHDKQMKYSPEWMRGALYDDWIIEREMIMEEEEWMTDDEEMWW